MAGVRDIPGELFAKFQTSFYADPVDAVFKALGVESAGFPARGGRADAVLAQSLPITVRVFSRGRLISGGSAPRIVAFRSSISHFW